jgi:alpha-1,2-mannosyltransferase
LIAWILILLLAAMAVLFGAGFGEESVWRALVSVAPVDSILARIAAVVVGIVAGGIPLVRLARSSGPVGWWPAFGVAATTLALAAVEIRELANVITITTDFGTYIRAAELLAAGHDPYAGTGGAYFYPPSFLFWIRPLTWVPIAWASLIWFCAKLVMLVLVVRWTFRLLEGEHLPERARAWFVLGALVLSARFLVADLQFGNTNLVIAFLIVGSVYFDLVRPSRLSGALVGIAAMIKVVPAVFLAWAFARRQMLSVGIALATLAILVAIPWILEPSKSASGWASYIDVGVQGRLGNDLGRATNQSLLGLALRTLPEHPTVARVFWVALSGLAIGFGMAMAHRHRDSDRLTQTIGAAYLAGCLIAVSPGSWVVHYTGAFLPLAALLRCTFAPGVRRRVYGLTLLLAFLAMTVSGWFRATVSPSLEGSWFLAALVLVLAALAFELWTRTPRSDTPET